MKKFKANAVVALREFAKKQGADIERRVLEKLSDKDRRTVTTVSSHDWIDMADNPETLTTVIAEILYPEDKRGPFKVSYQVGLVLLKSPLYKIFFQVMSVDFLLKRMCGMWLRTWDQGAVVVNRLHDHACELLLYDFKPLTLASCNELSGYATAAVEIAGKKEVEIEYKPGMNPQSHCWTVTWSD
jgi:hypothetical protein